MFFSLFSTNHLITGPQVTSWIGPENWYDLTVSPLISGLSSGTYAKDLLTCQFASAANAHCGDTSQITRVDEKSTKFGKKITNCNEEITKFCEKITSCNEKITKFYDKITKSNEKITKSNEKITPVPSIVYHTGLLRLHRPPPLLPPLDAVGSSTNLSFLVSFSCLLSFEPAQQILCFPARFREPKRSVSVSNSFHAKRNLCLTYQFPRTWWNWARFLCRNVPPAYCIALSRCHIVNFAW